MNPDQNSIAEPIQPPANGRERRIQARRKAAYGAAALPKAWLVLLAALTMIVLEGAFRKWVPLFGEGIWKYLMYFSKDIIFAAIIFLPVRSAPSPFLKVYEAWLFPGCALLGLGAAVSSFHGFNPVGAVLTARACLFLPLLAWLAVPRLAGLPLRRVAVLLALFTIVNFTLGVEQNRLLPDNFLNRYSDASVAVVATDSGVRASGTFSYLTGPGIISSVGVWAGLVLLGLARKQWQRVGAWATVAAGFGCGLVSVSRAPVVVAAAMVGGWLFLSKDGILVAVRGLVAGAFCMVIASGFGIMPVFSGLGQGLAQRWETAGDGFNNRAFGQLDETVSALQTHPLGNGFGTEQVGGQYYATGEAIFNHYESPLPRLVMETGAAGLLGYVMICAGALLALQRARRMASSLGARAALLATQLLLLPFFYGSLIFDHTVSAFVWMILAAVLAAAEVNANQSAERLKTESPEQKFANRNGGTAGDGRRAERAPYSATARQNEKLKSGKPES